MAALPGKGSSSLGVITLGVLAFAYVELCAPPHLQPDLQPAAAGRRRPLPYALPIAAGHTGQQRPSGQPGPPADGSHPLLITPTALTSAVTTARGPQQAARGPPVAKRRRRATDVVRIDETTSLVGNGSRGSMREVLADMSCEHDELYNNKGCQIRCTQQQGQVLPAGGEWSEAELALLRHPDQPQHHARCPRAFALCAALPHCLAVKTKTGQWGTLKASKRRAPPIPPRPSCSGYAFRAASADPPLVRFPLAAPREDWCYRHTGVEQATLP